LFDFPAITVSRQNLLQAPPTKSREGEEGGGDRIPQPLSEDAGRESQEARGGQLISINIPRTFKPKFYLLKQISFIFISRNQSS
jgi:hypothetical protein